MREFSAFFFVVVWAALFAFGWLCLLLRSIKLWVEGDNSYHLFLKARKEKSTLQTDILRPACSLNVTCRSSSAEFCTLWPFQKTTEIQRKAFRINESWGGDGCCFASVPLCAHEFPLLPSIPLFPCWELRFWSSKPGQPHDCSADGSNLCMWLWQQISGRSRVWEIPALLQRWIASQKSRVWTWLLCVKWSCVLFWTFFLFPQAAVLVLLAVILAAVLLWGGEHKGSSQWAVLAWVGRALWAQGGCQCEVGRVMK